jgi:hypothetical protein
MFINIPTNGLINITKLILKLLQHVFGVLTPSLGSLHFVSAGV